MLNKSIKFLIQNKLVAIILLVLFIAWGTINAPFSWDTGLLPSDPVAVDAIPDIGENQQIVFTRWQGRSPQDIEDQITYPLTTSLLGIPGVKTIRSSSMFGFSSIYIIFEEDVEFYWSRSRILEKLNSLPSGLLPEGVNPTLGPDATGLGQIFWYTLEGRDQDGNVTGGWDLQELRSIQDYYVKYGLSSAGGVSEVASIGGYVQEYQVDVEPELMRQYGIHLADVVKAVKQSNQDIGAQTLEINQAEYLVRGLGYVKSIVDIENAVVDSENFTSIRIKDVAKVHLGPAPRRGILDKEGAEVVGGVVVARYGANPMEVINNVKDQIAEISSGLPTKVLSDGRTSQVTIVPFYDRTELIHETISTLNEAITLQILITILVIVVMVFNLRASILITGLLPVAVLMVFITMKLFNVDANIVALSGIAIAIGTMVDVGVILAENMIRHLEDEKLRFRESGEPFTTNEVIYNATAEVSGAILTAVLTTIISFLPVFTMIGAEGKLFRPLAFTKTMALVAALIIALFLIPPFAAAIFKKREIRLRLKYFLNGALIVAGLTAVIYGYWLGLVLIAFGALTILSLTISLSRKRKNLLNTVIAVIAVVFLLAEYWRPLGFDRSLLINLVVVAILCFGFLGVFSLLRRYYDRILSWALQNRLVFLTIPTALLVAGFFIMKNTGKEFMPALNEGSFLLMPTSLPHAGVEENKRVLQQLDMAVASIPEIETVVGKAGRTESALDPAPLSMYENVIQYKSEYMRNSSGERQRYRVNDDGLFMLKNGKLFHNKNLDVSSSAVENPRENGNLSEAYKISSNELIEDDDGEYYRNWRPEIKSPDDIWNEIVRVTKLPGVTSAPKLQPIETRLVMLQTGMRAPMGVKVKGQDLSEIEAFGFKIEEILKQAEGVKKQAVFADRIVGKPYLLIDIKRDQLARYGASIMNVQDIIQVAVGGMPLTQTVEGRERYTIRVRYPRELRANPDDLKDIYVPVNNGSPVPLGELVEIRYEQGPQAIKSEDTFLVGYVLFDKLDGFAEVDVVENAQDLIQKKIDSGELVVPQGISYKFTGTYENQLRAEKTLSIVVPLCLIIIFLILYFQFKSVTTSLMVFTAIAVAFAGGFVMIWLYDQDWFLNFSLFGENLRELFNIKTVNLSVAVWVGFIALFGIATDDGVVMATYLNQTFDKRKPKEISGIRKATRRAAGKRIRPCLMTTVTTVLALLPVLTSSGKGSDIMIPMAIPIMGGMLIDVTSYFLLPVLYSWREEYQLKRANK
ncbi:cation transporter [Nonlabens spongiae]|uniref:Cation transporter n=1 Tax=Nonlabens spongiae TaxID=331648 RepID=A0A1W6MHV9_9FLAO|nr:efflux RND transporter permease subunit [Nonlabens spongiae]ARN77185.1 cation transporter [Nonlabens spongiae]